MGLKRSNDSAMEQFVFLRVKVSVAAVKMESSILGSGGEEVVEDVERGCDMASAPDEAEGMALGSWDDVFSAGPESKEGDGGGVG